MAWSLVQLEVFCNFLEDCKDRFGEVELVLYMVRYQIALELFEQGCKLEKLDLVWMMELCGVLLSCFDYATAELIEQGLVVGEQNFYIEKEMEQYYESSVILSGWDDVHLAQLPKRAKMDYFDELGTLKLFLKYHDSNILQDPLSKFGSV